MCVCVCLCLCLCEFVCRPENSAIPKLCIIIVVIMFPSCSCFARYPLVSCKILCHILRVTLSFHLYQFKHCILSCWVLQCTDSNSAYYHVGSCEAPSHVLKSTLSCLAEYPIVSCRLPSHVLQSTLSYLAEYHFMSCRVPCHVFPGDL